MRSPDAVATVLVRAGCPPTRPVRLHDLRHAAATTALAAGADMRTVQELLGHSSYAFTADTYTCVTSQRLRDLADATARLLLGELREHGTT